MSINLELYHYLILKLLYLLFGIYIVKANFIPLIKKKKIRLFDFFSGYYLISFCVAPFFILDKLKDGMFFKYLKTDNITYYYLVYIVSVFIYILCKRVYDKIESKRIEPLQNKIDINTNKFYYLNLIFVIFSWICLYLWTLKYGSIFGIFKYASDIRDGITETNRFAFLSRFCGFFVFSTFNLIILFVNKIKEKKFNIKIFLTLLISLFGTIIYLINIDSRGYIMIFLLVILFYFFDKNFMTIKPKQLLVSVLIFLSAFILISNMEEITYYIQTGKTIQNKDNTNFFVKEYSYVYTNNLNIFYMKNSENYDVKIRLIDNIKEIPFSWVPISLRPKSIIDLNDYNTSFYPNKERGEIPSDILTSSIYTFGFIGIFIYPIFYALMIAYLDKKFLMKGKISGVYKIIYYFLGWNLMSKFVTYTDIAPILNSYFDFIIFYLVFGIMFSDKINVFCNKVILHLMNKGFFNFLTDKQFIKLKYRIIFGKRIDLENPKTINEKMQWLKLYDRKDIYTVMVDKYDAKQYVSKIIGSDYIIPTLGIYNNFDEIDFDALPNQFVLKPTHTSGDVFICKDKSKIDKEELEKKVNNWLGKNYYLRHREWPYKNVKPRIIAEEYISELGEDDLKDYKFFVFNNKFTYSFVCSERRTNLKFTFFDKKGEFLDFTQDGCPNDPNVEKPKNYKEMIKLAEKLSKETIQIRVDFYEVKDKIYFGELTFFDSAGFGKFEPEEWDYKIGNWLKLPIDK